MADSKIEWTDATWNPVVGCARVSAGCEHCYAETMAARHVLMSQAQGRKSPYLPVVDVERRRWNRKAVFLPERLGDPLRWRKPRRVFVNSMSDLFHEDISFEQIAAVFGVMAAAPRHTFQVLTKRPARMLEFFRWADDWKLLDGSRCARAGVCRSIAYDDGIDLLVDLNDDRWPLPNVHLGVSVEDQRAADERIPVLLECPAALRFLSCEPLLGPLNLAKWIDPWTCAACNHHGSEADSGPCRCDDCGVSTVYSESLGSEQCPECGKDDGTSGAVGDTCPECGSVDGWSRDHGYMFTSRVRQIGWVIVGGESGPGARPCDVAWIRSIVGQCGEAGVPVFHKQVGAVPLDRNDAGFDGQTPEEWPAGTEVEDFDEARHATRYQGARVRVKLLDRKGGNPDEWPEDLRVRQLPGGAP